MGTVADYRDQPLTAAEMEMLDRARHAPTRALPIAKEIIDLPVLRPEHERAAKFLGKLIGIAVVYLIAGAIWTWRGAAWAVRRARR